MRTFWEANAHNKEKLAIYIKYPQIKLFSTYLIILLLNIWHGALDDSGRGVLPVLCYIYDLEWPALDARKKPVVALFNNSFFINVA